ncbi:hypothetical protein E7939_21805 [Salmonella enterica]|nr:hypothetical protein [Salmonella enterica]
MSRDHYDSEQYRRTAQRQIKVGIIADRIAKRQIRVGLLAHAGMPPKQIAKEVGCAVRTVRDDLEAMDMLPSPPKRKNCGTTTGYRDHHKHRDPRPCDACRAAKTRSRKQAAA